MRADEQVEPHETQALQPEGEGEPHRQHQLHAGEAEIDEELELLRDQQPHGVAENQTGVELVNVESRAFQQQTEGAVPNEAEVPRAFRPHGEEEKHRGRRSLIF